MLPSRDPSSQSMLEPPQGLAHAGGHNSRLWPKEKNYLYHRLKEGLQHPHVSSFLCQDPRQMIPLLLRLPKVDQQRGSVIAQGHKNSSKALEGCHQGEWAAIWSKYFSWISHRSYEGPPRLACAASIPPNFSFFGVGVAEI